MMSELSSRNVVLLGVGHTNAHVVRMWPMDPPRDAQLICVSHWPIVTYSGMLPGVLAGDYPESKMQIDLVRLCASSQSRLIVADVTEIDVTSRQLKFRDRPPLPYDVLSIGIGSVPQSDGLIADDSLVRIKPMWSFLDRLDARLRHWQSHRQPDNPKSNTLRIAVVGAGVGGVEIAFCLPGRIRQQLGDVPCQLTLISATDQIPLGAKAKTQRLVLKELHRRGVEIVHQGRVTSCDQGVLSLSDGRQLAADITVWATGAVAPHLLFQPSLPQDDRGFLRTRSDLRSIADDRIFVVGDSGSMDDHNVPKAGVYAVRQGPILWHNIRQVLAKQPLKAYVPQHDFLKLINLGNGRAIAEYRAWSGIGRWWWKLKDRIDVRFIEMYQQYRPFAMKTTSGPMTEMRCLGCGGKVGGSLLSRTLGQIELPSHADVVLGLDHPDDAALVRTSADMIAWTVDFFAAPIDDPYVVGRIAALHSASDLFAMGVFPKAALAMVTVPYGKPSAQERVLRELLEGLLYELRAMGTALVGGHTTEGPQLTVGLTMLGDQNQGMHTKQQVRPDQVLILTKPLGTGILLAAQMRAQCEATWFARLLESMLTSNQTAARIALESQIDALTDVTGFGLAGHLLEMLNASQVSATIDLAAIPILPGVESLVGAGLESTLAPANRDAEAQIQIDPMLRSHAKYPVLFDPQTSGGLLIAVSPSAAPNLLAQLRQCDVRAVAIGKTTVCQSDGPRLTVA